LGVEHTGDKVIVSFIDIGDQTSVSNIYAYFHTKIKGGVFMEGPIEPNMGPSLADVLLCTFESTDAGFS
jgi:hypothetical protein